MTDTKYIVDETLEQIPSIEPDLKTRFRRRAERRVRKLNAEREPLGGHYMYHWRIVHLFPQQRYEVRAFQNRLREAPPPGPLPIPCDADDPANEWWRR